MTNYYTKTASDNRFQPLSSATTQQLNYLVGVSSAIQTQIDSKFSASGGSINGNVSITGNNGYLIVGANDANHTNESMYLRSQNSGWSFTSIGTANVSPNDSNYFIIQSETGNSKIVFYQDGEIDTWNNILDSGGSVGNMNIKGSILNQSLTASKVLCSDANKNIISSNISGTTLAFLDATSSIQTQIDLRAYAADLQTTNNMFSISNTTGPGRNYNKFGFSDVVNSGNTGFSTLKTYWQKSDTDITPLSVQTWGMRLSRYDLNKCYSSYLLEVNGATKLESLNLPNSTASMVCIVDANKNITSSAIPTTTLAFLDATSSIQDQLDDKLSLVPT